ncbi:hypothetical protein F5883DRAFT_671360, partial [Diaporthe sp. PMI_573]
ERYAQSVVNYSKVGVQDEYLSGIHYTRLGNFLISPYKSYGDEWTLAIPESGFHFITICDLAKKRDDPTRTIDFENPQGFLNHFGSLSTTSTFPGLLVFLRGFPCANWLNHLGATFDVDPEFFYRHLDVSIGLLPNVSRLDSSYSTPFTSAENIIHLRVCNTGSWDTNGFKPTIALLRERCEASMSSHLEDFARMRNFAAGDSIVRRFMVHGLNNFAIEQKISVEVIRHTLRWSIVVWMDSGMDLSHCKTEFPLMKMTRLHPVFQHRSQMALSYQREKAGTPASEDYREAQRQGQHFAQSINHMHERYGRFLKTDVMANDAFYAMNKLFEFSAASIDQLLELFENNIRVVPHHADNTVLSQLLIHQAYVDDYRSYLRDILDTIAARGSMKWPRAQEPKHRELADHAAEQLEAKYRRLLRRCERLSEQHSSSVNILMSLESQSQSEKAMAQADRLGKLSVLAYIYIPITFATSFYGMNFVELGTQLSIWTYFAMAAPLLAISLIAWFINVGKICTACWRFIVYYLRI